MHEKEKGYNIFQNIIHLLVMAYKHYRIVFMFIVAEMICSGLLPLFGLYLPKLAVDLVLDNEGLSHAMLTLGGFAAVYIGIQCLNSMASQGKYPYQNNLRFVYTRALFEKALDCDYAIMETSEGHTWYEKARATVTGGDSSATTQMFNAVTGLISGFISFAFIFGILSNLSLYILVLLLVLSALFYFLKDFSLRYEVSQRDTTADLQKKSFYMERAMADTGAAKDIRIYNLSPLFRSIKESILHQMFFVYSKIEKRRFLAQAIRLLLTIGRDGIAYAYCIRKVVDGSIAISDFVLYMGAIASFSAWLNDIINHILTLKRENIRLNDLRAFFDYTNKLEPEKPVPISVITYPVEIEFKNVGFRYTEDTPKILDGLSFRILPNEKTALVGVNGAGKTTIIKLLCGFYKVNEGEILLNGYNLDVFSRADLYTLFSAVFQDICILPVTAGENISFMKAAESDEERLLHCLELAGIKDEIMKYDKKLNTPMLKAIDDNGIMLSGGQQQKLLLARALYKDAPILILDEPTAALDPIAESEVYEKFREVTENKTAVYISHRLASTRFCDQILVLKDGRIIEKGSHDELMAQKAEYAYIFEVQSHYYKHKGEAV